MDMFPQTGKAKNRADMFPQTDESLKMRLICLHKQAKQENVPLQSMLSARATLRRYV